MGILQGFTGWHALIILVVVVLLFGAAKLPALAKSVGQSMKIFKSEIKSDDQTDGAEKVRAETAAPVAQAPAAAAVPVENDPKP